MLLRGVTVTPCYTIMISTFSSKNVMHLSLSVSLFLSVVFAIISDLDHAVRLQFTNYCYHDLTGFHDATKR